MIALKFRFELVKLLFFFFLKIKISYFWKAKRFFATLFFVEQKYVEGGIAQKIIAWKNRVPWNEKFLQWLILFKHKNETNKSFLANLQFRWLIFRKSPLTFFGIFVCFVCSMNLFLLHFYENQNFSPSF